MAWVKKTNLRGPAGPAGPANTLEIGTVVAATAAGATLVGTNPQVLNLQLPRGAQGLPGTNGVLSDAAVAGYISTAGTSATKEALDSIYAPGITIDADYTGVVDASAAVQAAVNTGSTFGVPVYAREGTLKLNKYVKLTTKLYLRGAGIGRTIFRPQGIESAFEYLDAKNTGSTAPVLEDITLLDFEIDGADQTLDNGSYSVATKGIFATHMRRLTVERVLVRNTAASGLGIDHISGSIHNVWAINCGRLNDGTNPGGSGIGIGMGRLDAEWEPLTISSCHTYDNTRYGIFVEAQNAGVNPAAVAIMGNTARGNLDGIGIAGGDGVRVIGNTTTDNTRAGIAVDSGTFTAGEPGPRAYVQGNNVFGNKYGIVLSAQTPEALIGQWVTGNDIHHNDEDGVVISVSNQISATAGDHANVKVIDNEIHRNGRNGIMFKWTNSGQTGLRTLRRFTIEDNRIYENGQAAANLEDCGIKFDSGGTGVATDHLTIKDNKFWDDQLNPTQLRALALTAIPHVLPNVRDNDWGNGTFELPPTYRRIRAGEDLNTYRSGKEGSWQVDIADLGTVLNLPSNLTSGEPTTVEVVAPTETRVVQRVYQANLNRYWQRQYITTSQTWIGWEIFRPVP